MVGMQSIDMQQGRDGLSARTGRGAESAPFHMLSRAITQQNMTNMLVIYLIL